MGSRSNTAERSAFEHYLRTGQRSLPQAVEHKYNHNHDPQNGQFTFAGGGGVVRGPFRLFAHRSDAVGDAARKLNRVVRDSRAKDTLSLLGSDVTIARTGANSVSLSGRSGDFHAAGTFHVVPGHPAVDISISSYGLSGSSSSVATITSFPSAIRLYATTVGSLVYTIDRALVIKGPFGAKVTNMRAGTYDLVR